MKDISFRVVDNLFCLSNHLKTVLKYTGKNRVSFIGYQSEERVGYYPVESLPGTSFYMLGTVRLCVIERLSNIESSIFIIGRAGYRLREVQ